MPRKKTKKKEVEFSDESEMLPHSEAKIALYSKYLEKYLAILGVVKFINRINIFDIFCGTGVYKNGKMGSPIMAYRMIQKTKEFLVSKSHVPKPVSLIINDGNIKSINKVSGYIKSISEGEDIPCCDVEIFNHDAKEMFGAVLAKLKAQSSTERNIVFIDPTGYKEIHKEYLYELLKCNSEIVLFLPISFMYRFKGIVQKDFDNASYVHLRRFIEEFFSENHPIRQKEEMDVFQFISYLQEVFQFDNQYYTSSFFLQRNRNNYYSLFFITSSSLGLERINDAKWDIDKSRGQGFIYEEKYGQMPLFINDNPEISKGKLNELEVIMKGYIISREVCTNCDLYHLVILKGFRVKHANQILIEWQDKKSIMVWDTVKNQEARKKSFYLNNDLFRNNEIKATFKMI